jgi:hypothetical protein
MRASTRKLFVPPREWEGCTAFIIGGGNSVKDLGHDALLPKLEGRHPIIAVNNAFLLCPSAEVLFAADSRWWMQNDYALPLHRGFWKITRTMPPGKPRFRLHQIHAEHKAGLSLDPRIIHGRNGAHMAMNVAMHFGASRIVLVGVDLHERDRKQNWHDYHSRPANTEAYKTWRDDFASAVPVLAKAGVTVLNANPGSAVKAFPFCNLGDFV